MRVAQAEPEPPHLGSGPGMSLRREPLSARLSLFRDAWVGLSCCPT